MSLSGLFLLKLLQMKEIIRLNTLFAFFFVLMSFFSFYLASKISLEISLFLNTSIYVFLLYHFSRFKSTFSSKKKAELTIVRFLLIIVLAIFLNLLLNLLINLIHWLSGLEVEYFQIYKPRFSSFQILYIVFLSPLIEEFFYRGFLFRTSLLKSKKKLPSLFISSLVFSLAHIPRLDQMFFSFFLGIFCALIFMKTNRLIFSIVLHSFFNFVGVIYLTIFYKEYVWFLNQLKFDYYFTAGIIAAVTMLFWILFFFFQKSIQDGF